MALEGDVSSKNIYGDGIAIATIVNDKGKNGTLTSNNITNEYEIAMGRKIKTSTGLADIKQTKVVEHAIYFETCNLTSAGKTTVSKTWLFGCFSASRPAESYDQTTDDTNEATFENNFTIRGTKLLSAEGTTPYKDLDGNEVYVWQTTVLPGDVGYETFGESVPVVKMGA